MIRTDFYAVLGVAPVASAEEIRQAYYQLARQHHPDSNANTGDAEQFKLIAEAYRVLGTPQLRVAYDNALRMMDQRQATQGTQGNAANGHSSASYVPGRGPITNPFTSGSEVPPNMAAHPPFSPQPALVLRVTPGQPDLTPLRDLTRCYLLTELGPAGEPAMIAPQPLDLALLVDRSNSMQGEKFYQTVRAIRTMLDQLNANDLLTLVFFDDFVQVVADGETIRGRAGIEQALRSIVVQGSTELAKGLEETLNRLAARKTRVGATSLLLLTDGHTYGDEQKCLDLAARARDMGISITTLGLGVNWNRRLLDRVAAISGGGSNYVSRPTDVLRYFEEIVRQLRATLALNMRLTFEPAPGVQVARVTRVAPDIAEAYSMTTGELSRFASPGGGVTVDLGALVGRPERETTAVVWELLLNPQQLADRQGLYTLGQFQASFVATQHNNQLERLGQEVMLPINTGGVASPFHPDVRLAMQIITAYRCQDQADELAQDGQGAEALAQLNTAALRLRDAGQLDLATETQQVAQALNGSFHATGAIGSDVTGSLLQARYGTKNLGLFHRLRKRASTQP